MLRIGIMLEGDTEKHFLAIQKRLGIQAHSDVIRFLINDKYQQISAATPPISLKGI